MTDSRMDTMTPEITIATYADWARRAGFAVDYRAMRCGEQDVTCLMIRTPEGQLAVEFLDDAQDVLLSTSVARLDRMLGRKSALFR